MNITINGTPREIAALVAELQERQKHDVISSGINAIVMDATTNYATPLTRTKSGVVSGASQDV